MAQVGSSSRKWLEKNLLNFLALLVAVVGVWYQVKGGDGGGSTRPTDTTVVPASDSSVTSSSLVSTTTEPSTTTNKSTSPSTSPLRAATIKSTVLAQSQVEGTPVRVSDLYSTTSDGTPKIKSTTPGICSIADGYLNFSSAGKCQLKISIGRTSRYSSVSKSLVVDVLGSLPDANLSAMEAIWRTSYSEPGRFVTTGESIKWVRFPGEFKTTWHFK